MSQRFGGRGSLAAPSRALAALALGAAVALAAACGGGDGERAAAPATSAEPTVALTVERPPDLPTGPARRLDVPPGTVRLEPGPFDDRVRVAGLRLARGQRPALAGSIRTTVDVTHLIVLELEADFYDARGRYLASGRQVLSHADEAGHGEGEGAHGELAEDSSARPQAFRIRSRAAAASAVSAVLRIPALVNE